MHDKKLHHESMISSNFPRISLNCSQKFHQVFLIVFHQIVLKISPNFPLNFTNFLAKFHQIQDFLKLFFNILPPEGTNRLLNNTLTE